MGDALRAIRDDFPEAGLAGVQWSLTAELIAKAAATGGSRWTLWLPYCLQWTMALGSNMF